MTPNIVVNAPYLVERQRRGWSTLFALYREMPSGWTVIGGQMAQLHAWERGVAPARTTEDIDAGLGYREVPEIGVTASRFLQDAGYRPVLTNPDGPQVRWRRDDTEIDLLIPVNAGRSKHDVLGRRLLEGHGIQQALDRSEAITLRMVDGEEGMVLRPTLYSSLVTKCAALSNTSDSEWDRHVDDILFLAQMLDRKEVEVGQIRPRDRQHFLRAKNRLESQLRAGSLHDPDAVRRISALAEGAVP